MTKREIAGLQKEFAGFLVAFGCGDWSVAFDIKPGDHFPVELPTKEVVVTHASVYTDGVTRQATVSISEGVSIDMARHALMHEAFHIILDEFDELIDSILPHLSPEAAKLFTTMWSKKCELITNRLTDGIGELLND